MRYSFCISSEVGRHLHSFVWGYCIITEPSVEKTMNYPLNDLALILTSTDHKYEGFYFWFFNSVPCTCKSVCMLVPYRLDYCSFAVSSEKVESVSLLTLFFFDIVLFQHCFHAFPILMLLFVCICCHLFCWELDAIDCIAAAPLYLRFVAGLLFVCLDLLDSQWQPIPLQCEVSEFIAEWCSQGVCIFTLGWRWCFSRALLVSLPDEAQLLDSTNCSCFWQCSRV